MNARFPILSFFVTFLRLAGILLLVLGLCELWSSLNFWLQPPDPVRDGAAAERLLDFLRLPPDFAPPRVVLIYKSIILIFTGFMGVSTGFTFSIIGEAVGVLFAIEGNTRKAATAAADSTVA